MLSRSRVPLYLIPAVVLVFALLPCATHAGVTTRVSVATGGGEGNGSSGLPAISGDGRYVAFSSDASNLVANDTNGCPDVFCHDRWTGTTTRVSVASNGAQADGPSPQGWKLSISVDGRYVAFASDASNLVANDTNGKTDVFIHDCRTGATTRMSVASDGTQANNVSDKPSVSADGRFVAFESPATNLVADDTNLCRDVFVHDTETGQTTRISVASDGTEGNGVSWFPSVSADGRYVVFQSAAWNFVPYDPNCAADAFIHDRQTGETTSVCCAGANWCDGNSATISADGRYVAFRVDCWQYAGLFVQDRVTGQWSPRIDAASDGTPGSPWSSGSPTISADGRQVAFFSDCTNLVSGDTNNAPDIFVRDMAPGTTSRVSVASDGTQGNGGSGGPSISSDGRFVAFYSSAANLVPGDTNGQQDIFVHDRYATGTPPPGGVPGWDEPPGATIGIRNPYAGYTVQRHAKGQLHCHYYNDTPRMRGFGSWSPSLLVGSYAGLGYDFVCVTEHYHCTTNPGFQGPLFFEHCEEVTKDSQHVLGIGIQSSGCSGLSAGLGGDESRYYPWDPWATTNGLCEVEQFDAGNLYKKVGKVLEWGGFAAVAHPSFGDNAVPEPEIQSAQPHAMSVYTAAVHSSAVDKWNSLLASGSVAPLFPGGQERMLMFGITEDDFTPPFLMYAQGRTWVVAELDSPDVTRAAILNALKRGRFWSYWSYGRRSGTGPILSLSMYQNGDGKHVIRVTSDTLLGRLSFVYMKKHEGVAVQNNGLCTSAEYVCSGDEKFVRVEATREDITIYSQPIALVWNYLSGAGAGATSTGNLGRLTVGALPADIVYACALPEELPAKLPPLGYTGRAYNVSTTSGTYPPDATLTLSYEGIDVMPYGTSNLAIYRWDSVADAWVKLTSTVDIGNALVTAPLTGQGLYTISAEIVGDTTDPTVTIQMPSDGATLTGPDVIGVQAYDNVGVLRTTFYLGDQCIGTDSTGWDGYTCEYDFGKKSAGAYTLKVIAEDVSGNTGQAQVSINISSSGMTPAVTITSPSSGAELTGTATITGTCADNSLVAGVFILADGIPVGEAQVTGGNWTFDLDTSQLANGPHALAAQVLDDDQNTFEQGISATIAGPTLGSLAEAKSVVDGGQARLSGRVVTFGDPGYDGAFWIEEFDRFAGIRVQGSLIPSEGDMVSASGVMSTLEGERALVGADVLRLSSSNPLPPPLAMRNKDLGGAAHGLQPGVVDFSDPAWWRGRYSTALNNIGLLIATWGRVTVNGDVYLYIDDGGYSKDGTLTGEAENIGVRVICDPAGYSTGDFLIVTGISSCFETPAGEIARRILTRKPEDVRKVYP